MTPRAPLLDIVVLVNDRADWADLCIRAVESFTKNPYRLIVVDSASEEAKTKALLSAVENRGHTVVRLGENRSFSSGVNAGVAVGDARFVVILNDDALVTEGWDTLLLQDASEKSVGLVGARSNYAAGAQGDPQWKGEPPYLVFVCVALRREVWNAVGPMDAETFDGFSCEDLDYSWRVQKAGYKLKVSNAFVLHAGSRTLIKWAGSTGGAEAAQTALAQNNAKYTARLVDKWGKDWTVEHSKMQQKGLVVTYHAEEWTRVAFMGNVIGLRRSDGIGFSYHHMTRAPIHMARQAACDYALDQGYDWLVQLDDDAVFPTDVLRRLLAHQKDVVTALAYQRRPPHLSCVFELGEDGILGTPLEGIERTGLRKVDVSGFHCSIIKTSVFKKLREAGIKKYWGGFDSDPNTKGVRADKVGEDFAMSLALKQIGVQLYCDTDLISGHIGSSIVVDEDYKKNWAAGQMPTALR